MNEFIATNDPGALKPRTTSWVSAGARNGGARLPQGAECGYTDCCMSNGIASLKTLSPTALLEAAGITAYRKGQDYYVQRRVAVERLDENHAVVRVQGSEPQPYRVDVDVDDQGHVDYACDCPAFDEFEICKHVVAAVLALRAGQARPARVAWETTLTQALETAATAAKKAGTATARTAVLLFSLQKRSAYWSAHLYSLALSRFSEEALDDPSEIARTIADDRLSAQATRVKTVPPGAGRFINLTSDERRAATLAASMSQQYGYGYYSYGMPDIVGQILPLLGETSLIFIGNETDPLRQRVRLIGGERAVAALRVQNDEGGGLTLEPILRAGDEVLSSGTNKGEFIVREPVPYLLIGDKLIALSEPPSPIFSTLAAEGRISVPAAARERFVKQYLLPLAREIALEGDAFAVEQSEPVPPQPRLYLLEEEGAAARASLRAQLRFGYGESEMPYDPGFPAETISGKTPGSDTLVRVTRDPDAERAAWESLSEFGLKKDTAAGEPGWFKLRARTDTIDFLMRHAPRLAEGGFAIYGEESLTKARVNRNKPTLSLRVSSGIDWFDVEADVNFGDTAASLKEVRRAVRKRERYVKLADGSIGLLPEDWLEKYRHLFALSEETDEGLRLSSHHALLLDQAIEDAEGGAHAADAEFVRRKQRLRDGFASIQARDLPPGLTGTLYPYQKAGYDWLHFLHEYGFGGCLADDMGLGKTITALSFLLSLRRSPTPGGEPHALTPDLIVVPRSLLFNWEREAQKFTPDLKVLIYADGARAREAGTLDGYDLVITTYGILLRDIEMLRDYPFHYALLDEAQAIKNPLSQTARAARLVGSEHRLTLTGTPVENSALELWSQFAFLNPGLLGSLEGFKEEFAGAIERRQDEKAADTLRGLIQPFLLRRTKDQVAPELPPRTERIRLTDMDPAQSKLYARVRDYYRAQVLGLMEDGSPSGGGTQMKILEGLLRLRQVCNHPKLVEPEFKGESAKFDALLETLETLRSEGHKALVFSQFVQMLTLIRDALDARGIPYVYLDGRTRDRQQRVDRFQNEPELPFFLISLKAGGVGLNLTAADYVLHVDPWWNPAVEQQATDRAHRIGQTKPVFVDKFIVKDSVEEKILILQDRKRNLANQLISTEESFFKSLTRDDIAALFS
jgi:non-specific serine/threonine protein kinase